MPLFRGQKKRLLLFELFNAKRPYSPSLTDSMRKTYYKFQKAFHSDKNHHSSSTDDSFISKTLNKVWEMLGDGRNTEFYYDYGARYFIGNEDDFGLNWPDNYRTFDLLRDRGLVVSGWSSDRYRQRDDTSDCDETDEEEEQEVIVIEDDEPSQPVEETISEPDNQRPTTGFSDVGSSISDQSTSTTSGRRRKAQERRFLTVELDCVLRHQERRGEVKFLVKLSSGRAEVWLRMSTMMDDHRSSMMEWAERHYKRHPKQFRNMFHRWPCMDNVVAQYVNK